MPQISITQEQLKQVKLFIGTPMYGGICAGIFSRSMADLSAMCTHHGIQLQIYYLFNESLIPRARNYIADEFMRSEATHLMWIDSDIGFNSGDILGLISLTISDPKYEIIGGAYAKKCISWEKVVQAVNKGLGEPPLGQPNDLERYVGDFVFNPKQGTTQIPINEPCEVLEVGTGFMMVPRTTMERFKDAYWDKYQYKPDHVRTAHFDGSRPILQYFQAEIDQIDFGDHYKRVLEELKSGKIGTDQIEAKMKEIKDLANMQSLRYLSEDYWFTQKAQAVGLKTWLCPWMKLNHMGSYVFSGSLADLAVAGSAATADAGLLDKYNNK